MKTNLKNKIEFVSIILLACIFAISLDMLMLSIERYYGIGECEVYRNDQQRLDLYDKN